MLRLQKHMGGLVRASLSKSITNQAGPLLELHYDRWTRLSPDLALPENAQVDWLNGRVARAPAAWDLQLDPDSTSCSSMPRVTVGEGLCLSSTLTTCCTMALVSTSMGLGEGSHAIGTGG